VVLFVVKETSVLHRGNTVLKDPTIRIVKQPAVHTVEIYFYFPVTY
jgi:hypothetical protein